MSTALVYHYRVGAATQYTNYQFADMCTYNGMALGLNANGLFQLDTGNSDNSSAISAEIRLPKTDLGLGGAQRVRSFTLEGIVGGLMCVQINHTDYYIDEFEGNSEERNYKVVCQRKGTRSSNFEITVSNKNGCYFLINNLSIIALLLDFRGDR